MPFFHERRKEMKAKITIEGMKCDGCVKRISNILEKIEGITSYDINLEEKYAEVNIVDEEVLDTIKMKIENLDFQVTNIEIEK